MTPSMAWLALAFGAVAAWLAARFGSGRLAALLVRHAVLDRPNERSSHERLVPRGGGLAVVVPVLVIWAALAPWLGGAEKVGLVVVLALPLLAVGWYDDRRGAPVLLRLAVQAVAVGGGLAALPDDGLVLQGLAPFWLDRVVAAGLWLWFVNLFNFMDGIDGIAGVGAACIGAGLALIGLLAGGGPEVAAYAAAVAAAALGFLHWNWPPARIFLGDVGSVPLGYLLGWLLLTAAAAGFWAAALLLPLYYLADATIVLGRRALRREAVWRPHRQHFYQRAAAALGAHAPVTKAVLAADLALVAAAVAASLAPALAPVAVVAGAAATGALLWYLVAAERRGSDADSA